MGQVTFSADFFGGEGSLDITVGELQVFLTIQNPTETHALPEGSTNFYLKGFAGENDHGYIVFDISGDVVPVYSNNYPKGAIPFHPVTKYVTSGDSVMIGQLSANPSIIFNKKTLNQYVKGVKIHLEQTLLKSNMKSKKAPKK